jgi:hypothetical protein
LGTSGTDVYEGLINELHSEKGFPMLKPNRTLLAILAIVLTGLTYLSTATPKADACWAAGTHNYYSDCSYTTLVGQLTVFCACGGASSWGTATSYDIFTQTDCSGGDALR